jgi:hypothetical protein
MTAAHRSRRARRSCVSTGAPPRESGRHGNDRGHASAALPTRWVTRKRGLHLLAVMTSVLAQCTPWHREPDHDSTWMGLIRDAVRPSVSQRRGQPCRQPRREGRWPMGEACTLLCWRRSAIRVRGDGTDHGSELTEPNGAQTLISCAACLYRRSLGPLGRHPAQLDPAPLVALHRLSKRDALGRLR